MSSPRPTRAALVPRDRRGSQPKHDSLTDGPHPACSRWCSSDAGRSTVSNPASSSGSRWDPLFTPRPWLPGPDDRSDQPPPNGCAAAAGTGDAAGRST
jgi:hypothetical protein